MNLHEYQAKRILARYGVPVPLGEAVDMPQAAEAAARKIGAPRLAVKAQIRAGGRGSAGAVRIVEGAREASEAARELLGARLVTEQTGQEGQTVRLVQVEEAIEAERLLYVALLVDWSSGSLALVGAKRGGEGIETRIARDPSILVWQPVDIGDGEDTASYGDFARRLGLDGDTGGRAAALLASLARAFVELDASLIEINPLAVTGEGDLVALDVKMALDDNALFRHPDLKALDDAEEGDPVEREAQGHQINYVRMDGEIGVVVNGAGLALATHDMLIDAGGRPANFMDIRTTASSLDIARGLDLLLNNRQVKAVLVNIHGGGMQRCDTVAEGIGISLKRNSRHLSMVVRFAGNNADYGRTLLGNYGVAYVHADDMAEAVERVVALVRPEAA